VLAMIEDKFFLSDLSLEAPVADLRAVSDEPGFVAFGGQATRWPRRYDQRFSEALVIAASR
jgi:hypothetical protein